MKMSKILFTLTICACAYLTYSTPITQSQDGGTSLEENIAHWIEKREFEVKLPYIGSRVILNARNLADEEIDLKVQMSSQPEARKSKLKKIFAPILILVILKAITLIPLALGVLGLKTWNAIQLAFVTFVISIGLAVYEMCKKIAADHVHPFVSHTAAWPAGRAMHDNLKENKMADAQGLAYSAYAIN